MEGFVRFPEEDAEVDGFVEAFSARTLPKACWTHAAHLLTGAWYVHGLGEAEATERMRREVMAYNVAVGGQNTATSGYHETVTMFWIKVLAGRSRVCVGMERGAFARAMVREFGGDREVLERYYGFDVVRSVEARREWVAPTVVALE